MALLCVYNMYTSNYYQKLLAKAEARSFCRLSDVRTPHAPDNHHVTYYPADSFICKLKRVLSMC